MDFAPIGDAQSQTSRLMRRAKADCDHRVKLVEGDPATFK